MVKLVKSSYRLMVRTLLFHSRNTGSNPVENNKEKFYMMASITQLVRVLGCGSRSHRFESCYSPLFLQIKFKKVIESIKWILKH